LQLIATGLLTVFKYFQNEATGNQTNPKCGQPQLKKRPDRGLVRFGPTVFFGPIDQTFKHYASGIPPRGFRGAASDNRYQTLVQPTQRKRGGEESEYTDSVSESDNDKLVMESDCHNTNPLEGDQSVNTSALGNPPVTPISQVPSLLLDNETALPPAEPFMPEHEWPISLSLTLAPMLLDSDIAGPLSNPDK
jgi:hypothetical protein